MRLLKDTIQYLNRFISLLSREAEKARVIASGRISCKKCRFKGALERPGMEHFPEDSVFRKLGRDVTGQNHYLCPNCKNDVSFSPWDILSPFIKLGFLGLVAAAIWWVVTLIFE